MVLSKIPTYTDINVLLLGEIRVGKTTFINALANYFIYETLDDALKEDLLWLAPTSFTITDFDTFEQRTIKIGDAINEDLIIGQSSTHTCRTYTFPIDERKVLRFIDTPGFGDSRGIDEDIKTFQNIMSCLNRYQNLNAICLLLKPNESRLTISLRFCLKELLTNLHRNLVNNIIFCFTNTRPTFYSPDETMPLLTNLLSELKQNTGIDIPFTDENTFSFDNEPFRFIAAHKRGITLDDTRKSDFEASWNTSVEQTSALLDRIKQCTPYGLRETISLNEARRLIYELSRPIAEITRNIQFNKKVINGKLIELKEKKSSVAVLRKKLRVPIFQLKCVDLPFPQTVCTASTCTRRMIFESKVRVDYSTHCHEACYLHGVAQNVVNHLALENCRMMNDEGICMYCNCSWNMHMHITYETEQVFTEIIDKSVDAQLKTKRGTVAAIQRYQQDFEKRLRDLRREEETLTSVCIKLSKFLYENSIMPFNDDLIKYVEHLVREEKERYVINPDNQDAIDGLEDIIKTYQEAMNKYRKILNSTQVKQLNDAPRLEDIQKIVNSLYKLRYSGTLLKTQIELIRQSRDATALWFETVCREPLNERFLSKLQLFYKK